MPPLADQTMFISGGSRGIGLAIALRAAEDGARVALLAKTAELHPRLEGTVFTAAAAIERAGGGALPMIGDIRDEEAVLSAVERTVAEFGGIDIVVNNASAIDVSDSASLSMKRFDLMQAVNARGAFLVSRTCVRHLLASANPHVLTLSPPISLAPRWFRDHLGYTISKYAMSMVTLGMAAEYAGSGIAFNSLWPRTLIATAAVRNLVGGREAIARSRSPQVMADAAHAVLARPARERSGAFLIDEDVLRDAGVEDFSIYQLDGGTEPELDLFVSE